MVNTEPQVPLLLWWEIVFQPSDVLSFNKANPLQTGGINVETTVMVHGSGSWVLNLSTLMCAVQEKYGFFPFFSHSQVLFHHGGLSFNFPHQRWIFLIHFRWKILVFKNQTTAKSLYKMWIPSFIKPTELWRPSFHYQTLTRPEPLLDQYIYTCQFLLVNVPLVEVVLVKKNVAGTMYQLKLSTLWDLWEILR